MTSIHCVFVYAYLAYEKCVFYRIKYCDSMKPHTFTRIITERDDHHMHGHLAITQIIGLLLDLVLSKSFFYNEAIQS